MIKRYLQHINESISPVWYVSVIGTITKERTNDKDKFVTYNTSEYSNINNFLEWMYINHISLDIPISIYSYNLSEYIFEVRFSSFNVKNSGNRYVTGIGNSIKKAIFNFMEIIEGTIMISDGGNHNYKPGEEIQIPNDFELWSNAQKYNL